MNVCVASSRDDSNESSTLLLEESISPIGSPARLDRPASHDASRGNSPGKAPAPGRVAVPRLSLPLPATQRPASAGMHRSTRRTSTNSHRNSPSLVSRLSSLGRSPSQREHSLAAGGPSAELAALAQSLAQSIVAQDLTALIRAKRGSQGSRGGSPMARDTGGGFSGQSTPAATPRTPTTCLRDEIEVPIALEALPPIPSTSVTDADLRRRCCVLESLRRLLAGGHARLDAATRQDALLWLIHETLAVSGDGETAVHRALCLQLLQMLGGSGAYCGRLDDTAKALEPHPSTRWLAAERWVFLGVDTCCYNRKNIMGRGERATVCIRLQQECFVLGGFGEWFVFGRFWLMLWFSNTMYKMCHRTLGACVSSACQRLSSVLSSGMHVPSRTAEACRLLALLRMVVLACPHPSLPRLVLDGVWPGMQLIKACDRAVCSNGPCSSCNLTDSMRVVQGLSTTAVIHRLHPQATLCDALPAREWPITARQLLQGMVNLLTALLHTTTEGPCAQRLLSLLFEVGVDCALTVGLTMC